MIDVRISGDSWTDVTVPLPRLRGEGRFRIKAPSTVRCATPRVLLHDTPLAVDIRQGEDGEMDVSAGPLEDGILVLAVRAVPPITSCSQGLRIECEGAPPILVSLSLSGSVRFVPGRSGWSAPESLTYGDQLDASLTLRNDGTLDLDGGHLELALPVGVVPAFKAEMREVDSDGRRVLHIDVPSLPVRDSVEVKTPLFVTDPNVNEVGLRARVINNGGHELAVFESERVRIVHKNAPQVVAHLIDGERLRFGDETRVQVNIVQAGAPIADSRLTVEGAYTEPLDLELGPLQHNERRTIPIALRLRRAAPSEQWEDRVFFRLHSSALKQPAAYNVELPCAGRALLRIEASVSAPDATGAHRVDITLQNRGDGIAGSPLLRAERISDVCAVVDSLSIDGVPQYELDGSVPIFDSGIRLRDLNLGERSHVSFAVRAARAVKAELTLSVFSGSVEGHAVTTADLIAAAARTTGTYQAVSAPVEAAPGEQPKADVQESAPQALMLTERIEGSAADATAAVPPEAQRAEEERAPALVYPSEWAACGREYLDDGQVQLGRHVLALLSWLPQSAIGSDGLDSAAKALTSEVQRVQLLGQAPLRSGFWGISGVAIATDGVKNAAEAFARAKGVEYPGGGQLTVLRWLSVQAHAPEPLRAWQQAIINALVNADSDEALNELMTYTLLEAAA